MDAARQPQPLRPVSSQSSLEGKTLAGFKSLAIRYFPPSGMTSNTPSGSSISNRFSFCLFGCNGVRLRGHVRRNAISGARGIYPRGGPQLGEVHAARREREREKRTSASPGVMRWERKRRLFPPKCFPQRSPFNPSKKKAETPCARKSQRLALKSRSPAFRASSLRNWKRSRAKQVDFPPK